MGVTVHLEAPSAALQPGRPTSGTVLVRNTGSVVDQLELDVVGDTSSWAFVEPSTLNLMPGEEREATITFTPPRSARVLEGPVPFALRVMSREDTAGSAIHEGTVEVAPFTELAADMVPRTSTGRRRGRHEVALDNLGNHPVLVSLVASDPDAKLGFAIEPSNLTLTPGTATFVKVVAKPKRRFLRGANVTIPFQVLATHSDGEPVALQGSMVQTAILPAWFAKAAAIAVAGAAALAVLWFTVLKPSIESTARDVAEDSNKKFAAAVTDATERAAEAQEQAAAASQQAAEQAAKQAEQEAAEKAAREKAGRQGSGGANGRPTAGALDPGSATDFRVVTDVPVGAGFVEKEFTPPSKRQIWVSDLVLQNPAGDSGTLRIQRGEDVLMVFGLENFRDLDYHFIQPALFTEDEPVIVAVQCTNEADPCSAAVYFSGLSVKDKAKKP